MPRIEPHLIPVVSDLARGLRELDVPFAIVGALVPELLLGVKPVRMTNDADATVVVQSTADFETLKDRLEVYGNAVSVTIDDGPTLPVVPLPLYVLLKLVAFTDRKAPKDIASVLHCLEHYLEGDDRRYDAEYEGEGVPYDYACAYLLGLDGRPFLDPSVRAAAQPVLARFDDPDADVVGISARENGRLLPDDAYRNAVVERFRWYRLGAGL